VITDEMLAEAAAELNEALINSLPDPHECKHQFSKKFERKMEKLIYRVKHPTRYMVLNRVASILLVILLGFTMVMSFSPTARAAVFGWIKQAYESFYSYYFETDVETESSYRYQIDPLPEGYTELSASLDEGISTYIYLNDKNELLVFTYSTDPDESVFNVKRENYSVEEVLILGNQADLYLTEDTSLANGIIWCDEENGVIFSISGKVDGKELKKLAESVKQVS
jgi:hypothetical protein